MAIKKTSRGSVRMGPVSLLTLVIALCLAVMAVLAISSAKATYASTQRQASFTTETYVLEQAGQRLLANADAATSLADASPKLLLKGTDADSVDADIAFGKTGDGAATQAAAQSTQDADVTCVFTAESGKTLTIQLAQDGTKCRVLEWQMDMTWNESDGNDVLWSGAGKES